MQDKDLHWDKLVVTFQNTDCYHAVRDSYACSTFPTLSFDDKAETMTIGVGAVVANAHEHVEFAETRYSPYRAIVVNSRFIKTINGKTVEAHLSDPSVL